MNTGRDVAALVGRVALALIFVISGFRKITTMAATSGYIASKGLPMPDVLAVVAIVIELGAGILLIIGWKARWAALLIAFFLLVITPIFHAFWAVPADQMMMQQQQFMKNLAILGGMLMLYVAGPGRFSVDGREAPAVLGTRLSDQRR